MKNFIRIIIASAVFAVAVPAHASIDLLLLIPGVEGFSNVMYDPKEPPGTSGNWNVLNSFEAGYDQDGCNEVIIEMGTNAATAQIIANGIMGTSNPEIYIHAVGPSGDPGDPGEGSLPRVYYTLHNGVITSVVNSASEGDEKIGTTIIIIPASITVETFAPIKDGAAVVSTGEVTISCSDKKKKKVK